MQKRFSPERTWIPPALSFCLFAILVVHGSTVGLTDDEAYYWALAQKPAWAYAYHPPMVAWLIAFSQHSLGWLLGTHSSTVVRLPSALLITATFALALRWLKNVGVARERIPGAGLLILSLAGIFALSWMMVPDLPLIFGWMLAFFGCSRFIARPEGVSDRAHGSHGADRVDLLMIGAGVAITILSKYSGVLVAGSAGLSILLCTHGIRDARRKWTACLVIIGASCLAAIPLLIWNAHHEWASILYQIRDRHEGGSLSLSRYLRFWVIELFVAGPPLLFFSMTSIAGVFKRKDPVLFYCWIWALPALLIYCTQPLWADFKPHWALIGWWPLMLALAHFYGKGEWKKIARLQRGYGLTLALLVLVACHVPLGNGFDPRLNVTNDLVGWNLLEPYIRSIAGNSDLQMPVVASRYQTAGQAYFALGPAAKVTLFPRDIKERDEWMDLSLVDERGALQKPILFVTDIRYDAAPEFQGASCLKLKRLEAYRGGSLAKWIDVWRCAPKAQKIL